MKKKMQAAAVMPECGWLMSASQLGNSETPGTSHFRFQVIVAAGKAVSLGMPHIYFITRRKRSLAVIVV